MMLNIATQNWDSHKTLVGNQDSFSRMASTLSIPFINTDDPREVKKVSYDLRLLDM